MKMMKMPQLPTESDSDSPEKKRFQARYGSLLIVRNLIFEASNFESHYETALKKTMEAEIDKKDHMKLSSIVFSRWVLEMFQNLISIKHNPQAKGVKAAWEKFLQNQSHITTVLNAYQKMVQLIPEFPEISVEVQRILNAPGNQSSLNNEKWIARRSTELYFKLSDIIHDLKKLNWNADLDILLPHLPEVKQHDIATITILHEIIKPLIYTSSSEDV